MTEKPPVRPARTYRKPTGLPSWPVLLLAGREKTGKSFHAALASSSDLIDRTFWVGWGEKDPDEYGAVDGARFEIVEHNNKLEDLRAALEDVAAIPYGKKPHLLVVDSTTKIWETLREKANYIGAQRGKRDKDGEVIVSMDIWNKVSQEWQGILSAARRHAGPVILTARLDTVAVVEGGRPTGQKADKIQGQKSIAYDVDAIVEMPERGKADLTGARSVIYRLPERTPLKDFTVDGLWRKLGLGKTATAAPVYAEPAALVDHREDGFPATDAPTPPGSLDPADPAYMDLGEA